MDAFLLILRIALAGTFGVAGIAKLFDPEGSEKAFVDFGMPAALAKPMRLVLPVIELTIAGSLLFLSSSWYGALGGAALLLLFIGGMIVQIIKGNAPDCHCFGQLHSEPVGMSSVIRNLVLFAGAGLLAIQGKATQGLPLVSTQQDVLMLVIGLGVIGVLLFAILYLKTISEQQLQIMRRIELLELVSNEGAVQREDAGHPHDGLPIGGIVPEFESEDLGGAAVSLAGIREEGLPVLFFYVSPNCAPCKALVPELVSWRDEFKDQIKFVFISSGKPDSNVEKFGDLAGSIILQKNKEISDLLMARWTPSAVLMDENGRIASHLAAGDGAIREMMEKIKERGGDGEVTHYTNNDHARVKIGEEVPEINVTDIEGRAITGADLRGKQTLITFWSTTCPHCTNMLPELQAWDSSKGEQAPNLIVFSDGDAETLKELKLRSHVVVDEGHKTSSSFGMFGTPSAVLIDENGRFVSETATGAANIWSLIGKRSNGKAA